MAGQCVVFWSHTSTAMMLALDFSLVVYNRNHGEGIDPNRIFTKILPA